MNNWEKLIIGLKNIKGDSITVEELESLRIWYKNALCGYVQPLKEIFKFIK